jgi:hypothetical protein
MDRSRVHHVKHTEKDKYHMFSFICELNPKFSFKTWHGCKGEIFGREEPVRVGRVKGEVMGLNMIELFVCKEISQWSPFVQSRYTNKNIFKKEMRYKW